MWSVRPACSPRYGVSRSTKRRNLTDQTWVPGEEAGRGERQNKPSSLHFSGKKDSLPTNIELKPPAYHPSRTRLRRKPNQKEGYILMVEKLKFGSLYMDGQPKEVGGWYPSNEPALRLGNTVPGKEITWIKSGDIYICLLYTSPSPRDSTSSRMPSSA